MLSTFTVFLISYLISIAANIQTLMFVLGSFVAFSALLLAVAYVHDDVSNRFLVPAKKFAIAAIAMFTIGAFIPSKSDMYFIGATTGIYATVTSDPAKEVGGKLVDLINKKLDEQLKEAKQ